MFNLVLTMLCCSLAGGTPLTEATHNRTFVSGDVRCDMAWNVDESGDTVDASTTCTVGEEALDRGRLTA